MKRNHLFDECVNNVTPEIKEEVNLNIDVINSIYNLLNRRKMSMYKFIKLMIKYKLKISKLLNNSSK